MASKRALLIRAAHWARMATSTALLAVLLMGIVAACSQPAGGGSSAPSERSEGPSAPVAPAIETDHPDAEQPIPMPSSPAPVAPAIETDHPDAEQPIPFPSETP
jgi:hypothetical protein